MHPREGASQAAPAPGADIIPQRIAAVCDQCHTLPTGPACQYACPHDAITISDWSTAFESQVQMALDTFSMMSPTTGGRTGTRMGGSTMGRGPGASPPVDLPAISMNPPSPPQVSSSPPRP
jgi:hypothetical protein